MQEKKFKQFTMTTYAGQDTSLELAIMQREIYLRKVTIDLAQVTTYRDATVIDEDGNDTKGTIVETIGSDGYEIQTPYNDFDRIMREAFPEAY